MHYGQMPGACGSGEPVGVVGGGEVCVLVGENVPLDDGEHAGTRVGNDCTAVALMGQGDPAELVQGEDLGAGNVADAVQRGARGNLRHGVGDVLGGDGLDRRAGQPDSVAIGG